MEKVSASSPGRVFLSGEAAFEYGSRVLAIPAEFAGRRTTVNFLFQDSTGVITAYSASKMGSMSNAGRVSGDTSLRVSLDSAKKAIESLGYSLDKMDSTFSMSIDYGIPASAGGDAATSAAVFAGIYDFFGNKRDALSALQKSYGNSQEGAAGEIDAIVVSSGSVLTFKREFLLDGTITTRQSAVKVNLPAGKVLLYSEPKHLQPDLSRQIAAGIALANGGVTGAGKVKPARDMTQNERGRAADAFSEITAQMTRELSSESPSPEKVASLFEFEHRCLCDAGVVSAETKAAVQSAKTAGAMAAKSSGYMGGVLALCAEKDAKKVASALEQDYATFPISIAARGMFSER